MRRSSLSGTAGRFPVGNRKPDWPYDINYKSWQADGLLAWFPIALNDVVRDLAGAIGYASDGQVQLAFTGGATLINTPAGLALDCTGTGAGAKAACSTHLRQPVIQAGIGGLTVVCVFYQIAAQGDTAPFIGLDYSNLNNPPYRQYQLDNQSGTDLRWLVDESASGLTSLLSGGILPSLGLLTLHTIVATSYITVGGSGFKKMYLDGVEIASASSGASLGNISGSPTFGIGAEDFSTNALGAYILDARVYNATWTIDMVKAFHDPAQMWELYRKRRFMFANAPVSSTAYEINAGSGSYTLTGASAPTLATRRTSASPGAYTVTGASAPTLARRVINAGSGSYSISGSALTILRTYLFPALAGSYTLSGSSAGLYAARRLVTGVGSYSITGVAATLPVARTLAALAGSYSITGASATFRRALIFQASPGTYSVTGASATTLATRLVAATAGSYSISGSAISLVISKTLVADPGSYTLTGASTTFRRNYVLSATPGTYSITGSLATLAAARMFAAMAGSYSISGVAANLTFGFSFIASPGSYAVTGAVTGLTRTRLLNALAGSYALTGASTGLLATHVLTATAGSYAVTGVSDAMLVARALAALAGSYQITGASAEKIRNLLVNAAPGVYVLSGSSVTFASGVAHIPPDDRTHTVTREVRIFMIEFEDREEDV